MTYRGLIGFRNTVFGFRNTVFGNVTHLGKKVSAPAKVSAKVSAKSECRKRPPPF